MLGTTELLLLGGLALLVFGGKKLRLIRVYVFAK